MSERLEEQVSALVDDELPAVERELLLHRLGSDLGLRGRWERYHLMRDVFHYELPEAVDCGLAERVSAALASEPVFRAPRRSGVAVMQRMVRPLAGLAVAASVAALAIVGVQHLAGIQGPRTAVPKVAVTHPNPSYVRVAGTRWNRQRPEIENRLNNFLMNHNEYSAPTNFQGMMRYVRLAGYDSGQ